MAKARESTDLESFLASLPEDQAAEVRVAAARIDALERQIGPPGWIERNLIGLAVVALVLFVLGVAGLIGVFAWGGAIFGLGGVTLMISAFPALMLAYLLSVRGQTRLDHEKMELNKRHFLPHCGLYLGSSSGSGTVVRVERPQQREANLRDRAEARYDAATKRKW